MQNWSRGTTQELLGIDIIYGSRRETKTSKWVTLLRFIYERHDIFSIFLSVFHGILSSARWTLLPYCMENKVRGLLEK